VDRTKNFAALPTTRQNEQEELADSVKPSSPARSKDNSESSEDSLIDEFPTILPTKSPPLLLPTKCPQRPKVPPLRVPIPSVSRHTTFQTTRSQQIPYLCGKGVCSLRVFFFIVAAILMSWSVSISFCELFLKNFFTVRDSITHAQGAPEYRHYGRTGFCQDDYGPYSLESVLDLVTENKVCIAHGESTSQVALALVSNGDELTALYSSSVAISALALITAMVSPFVISRMFMFTGGALEVVAACVNIALLLETARIARLGIDNELASDEYKQYTGSVVLVLFPANILMLSATATGILSALILLLLYRFSSPRRQARSHDLPLSALSVAVMPAACHHHDHHQPPPSRSRQTNHSPSHQNHDHRPPRQPALSPLPPLSIPAMPS